MKQRQAKKILRRYAPSARCYSPDQFRRALRKRRRSPLSEVLARTLFHAVSRLRADFAQVAALVGKHLSKGARENQI